MKNKNLQGRYIQKYGGGFSDVDAKNATIKGYLNTMAYVDSSRDNITSGAWDKTINEMGPNGANRLRYIYQHDMDRPIGKFSELYVQDDKLNFVVKVSEKVASIQYVSDTLTLIEEQVLDENSVGFMNMRGYYDEDKDTYFMTENKLFEGSVVTLADNDRSIITEFMYDSEKASKLAGRIDAMVKMVKKGKVSDDTILKIQRELLILKEEITALTSAEELPKPQPEEKELISEIKNISELLCQI